MSAFGRTQILATAGIDLSGRSEDGVLTLALMAYLRARSLIHPGCFLGGAVPDSERKRTGVQHLPEVLAVHLKQLLLWQQAAFSFHRVVTVGQ